MLLLAGTVIFIAGFQRDSNGRIMSCVIHHPLTILSKTITMDILTLGWVSVLVLFTWSIAMVVWGRNGF